jgi:hypothetical protein
VDRKKYRQLLIVFGYCLRFMQPLDLRAGDSNGKREGGSRIEKVGMWMAQRQRKAHCALRNKRMYFSPGVYG